MKPKTNSNLEKKRFWNLLDLALLPLVVFVGLVIIFKGILSQIYFLSDLITNKEVLRKNECFNNFSDDFCQLWGTGEEFDYSYEYRFPGFAFLLGDYPDIKDVNAGVLMFEYALVGYICYRVNKFKNFKRQKNQ